MIPFSTEKWGFFNLTGKNGLFQIETCKCSNAGDLLENGDEIEYIGAKKDDNGLMRYVKRNEELVTKGNCIIFICDGQGSVGYTNYIDHDFIGSTTLSVGYNEHLNENIGLFLVTVLDLERYRYSFGRKYKTNLVKTSIKLPITSSGTPDWSYMDNYIESLKSRERERQGAISDSLKTKNLSQEHFNVVGWKEFKLKSIFKVKKGKRLRSEDRIEGETIYIGAIDSNNGVSDLIGQEPIHEGNTISLSYNGSVGEAFYQPNPFWATDDVNVLYFKKSNGVEFNKYIAMFICTILRLEKYRYSYGRKWVLSAMEETIISLPAINDKPDWLYMENFIKNYPYGDRI